MYWRPLFEVGSAGGDAEGAGGAGVRPVTQGDFGLEYIAWMYWRPLFEVGSAGGAG
jgi:hypothetical protein